jgi:chemotaxis-related protein WspD
MSAKRAKVVETPVSVSDECWKSIGVHGDASCPELDGHAHCRNCPVFSAAAVDLLDREPPAGYVAQWTAHFAAEQIDEDASDQRSALIFRIGAEWFGLPTLIFDEVAEQRAIHSLPHRRTGPVLGLVNVRGELLVCVSLGKMLGLGEGGESRLEAQERRLVVVRHEGGRAAFPVDEVASVHRYRDRELKAVPTTVQKAAANHTKGLLPWREKMVGCLDETLVDQALNRAVA